MMKDQQELKKAQPYLRTFLALCVYLRTGNMVESCYKQADYFIERLLKDVASS